MRLIFVHGREQQGKDRDALRELWIDAWNRGLEKARIPAITDADIRLPFYGDEIAHSVKQLKDQISSKVKFKGDATDEHHASFREKFLREVAQGYGISDAEITSEYVGEAREKGPLNWDWIQAILRALDRTPLGAVALENLVEDVYAYLAHRPVSKIVHDIVRQDLSGDECVVVAHSLGSIVAFRLLRELQESVLVKGLITLGSPLGLNAIRELLVPPALSMPAGIRQWMNAYDRRDGVALFALDSKRWDVIPPIVNKSDVNNHTENRHGIVGYLDDPIVAKWIHDAIVQ